MSKTHSTGERRPLLGLVIGLLILAGCTRLPGAAAAAPRWIAANQMMAQTIQIGDIPNGFQLVLDLQPSADQLAKVLTMPGASADLRELGRSQGTYRAFTYTLAEPTDLNGTTSATIEVDFFPTPANADTWMADRQSANEATGELPLDAPAPGQQHAITLATYRAATAVATQATLAFVEKNVYVEIHTTFVGPGPSLADATRFADLIDARLLNPTGP